VVPEINSDSFFTDRHAVLIQAAGHGPCRICLIYSTPGRCFILASCLQAVFSFTQNKFIPVGLFFFAYR